MTEADNTMRAEFEAWWAQGSPSSTIQGIAWDAWQAARADTARQVVEAVAAEREACAVACEFWAADHAHDAGDCTYANCDFVAAAEDCSAAIRERATPAG